MKRIVMIAAGLMTLTACTPAEIKAWLVWHEYAPEQAEEWAARPEVQESLKHDWDQDGVIEPDPAPAVRVSAPSPSSSSESSDGRCVGYEGLLAQYSPGWDVVRMSRIMYRESRCNPGVSNSCCHGLLQMHEMHVGWINAVDSASDYYNPASNIAAAAELWRASGYGAWSL